MKWKIGTKIGSGYALALATLIIIAAVAYHATNVLLESAGLVARSHEVIECIERLVSVLKDAETGQRGYIITGEDSYLEPYNVAREQVDPTLKEVRELTADSPAQQQRLNTIDGLVAAKMAELQSTIDLRKDPKGGFDAARQVVLTDKGKKAMDDIRETANEMEAEETDLLKHRAQEAAAVSAQTRSTILWGSVWAVAILAVVGAWITRNISGPLNELTRIAGTIASGELRTSVFTNDRADEVGELLRTFSRMNRSLQDMSAVAKRIAARDLRVDIKPQSEKDELGTSFASMVANLRQSTSELSEGVGVLAASASEILAATTQVASGAAETGTAIAQTTTTVEEVKQTAQNASQKAKSVSEVAQRLMQTAHGGRKSVEGSIEGMKRIQGQMESIAESVVRLSEQNQSIGEIIATVNDLAEQSNLLAVNAAIEAAKAGEQGRGFSVVAQEVKSLAEQSKQATAQVRAILNEIQKATTAAVLATEQGSKSVDIGVKQSLEAGESIRVLADGITEAAQAATQIAASSQQQMVGTDQVAMAMENIKQASSQNVAGTKQAEVAAHNLHELGLKLKLLVDQYTA